MRLLWKWTGLPVVLLVVSCGVQPRLNWPAEVAIEVTDPGKASVASNIENLNSQLGKTILQIGSGTGSPIYIKSVTSFSSTSSIAQGAEVHFAYVESPVLPGKVRAMGTASTRIAGRATLDDSKCVIELASFLFESTTNNLLLPVLWHEIGHCGGLQHVDKAGELMSAVTLSYSKYSQEQIQSFFDSLLSAIR